MKSPAAYLKKVNFKLLYIFVALIFGYMMYTLPQDLSNEARVVFATFGIAGTLWLTEAVPLFVTSFVIAAVLILFGGIPTKEVFNPFFDPIIVLFLGGFVLAQAFSKFKVDLFISEKTLGVLGKKPYNVMLGLMILSAVLSMWMSNTAAAALLLPIAITILKASHVKESDPLYKAFPLAIAYAATTGGLGTIIGSPPNALAVKYLVQEGFEQITFTGWMGMMMPLVVALLVVIFFVVKFMYKTEVTELTADTSDISDNLSKKGKITMLISLITVTLWLTGNFTGLSSYVVALIPILFFYGSGYLEEKDIRNINWETLLLFGGGLALGEAVMSSGVNEYIAGGLEGFLSVFPLFALYLLIGLIGIGFTVVASNTGAAVVMMPIVIPLAVSLGINPTILIALTTAGVSLDFILPVGTPPSAIAYSSGYIKAKEMMKTGLVLTVFVVLIPAIIAYLIW